MFLQFSAGFRGFGVRLEFNVSVDGLGLSRLTGRVLSSLHLGLSAGVFDLFWVRMGMHFCFSVSLHREIWSVCVKLVPKCSYGVLRDQ